MNFNKYHVSRNLFDESTLLNGYYGNTSPYQYFPNDSYRCFSMSLSAGTYTILAKSDSLTISLLRVSSASLGTNTVNLDNQSYTFTLSASETIYVTLRNSTTTDDFTGLTIMLNVGETPEPYEPYSSEVWHDIPYYIHNTSTDTITLPAVLYPNGTTATVGLKGQMEQSSTPTPTTPVQPSECGERTAQLFDENYPSMKIDTPTYRSIYVGDGTFTLSTTTAKYQSSANLFFLAGNVGSGASTPNNGIWNGNPRTVTAVDGYVTIAYRYYTNDEASDPRDNDVMLNSGSTAKPFEPYGYKIPISSANTTTPVYLGEVETTRLVKNLVLTGEESFVYASQDDNRFVCSLNMGTLNMSNVVGVCSHFVWKINYDISDYNRIIRWSDTMFYLSLDKDLLDEISIDGFKAYLAQQYSNGTPVTVWYVLAEPTTGIVNEPLRKIGDYADTVSGISIPTITGADSFDVLTTLKPSEVELTYTGWHDAEVKEFDGEWKGDDTPALLSFSRPEPTELTEATEPEQEVEDEQSI